MLRWGSITLLLLFVFSFSFRTDNSFDQDLGRHLKLGEIISKTGEIPDTNLFSYTYPDYRFINHHWLFEYLIYQGDQLLGTEGLLVIKILIILFSVLLVLLTVPRSNVYLVLPVGLVFLHLLRERIELRPEIFSFFFTSLTLFVLHRFETRLTKLPYMLLIVQLLWVNIHIYFPIGLLLQGIFLADLYWRKEWSHFKQLGFIFLGSLLLSLANPNSITGLIYPLTVFGNYGYTIVENQNIWLLESINFKDPNFLFFKISALIILISLIISWIKKTVTVRSTLLVLMGLGLATLHMRSFPYISLISLPAVINLIGPVKKIALFNVMIILTSVLLLYESFFYLSGNYYRSTNSDKEPVLEFREHLKSSTNFLIEHQLPNPIFNNFDIGSYLIYRGYPNYQVFVDGRPEAYPAGFFQEVYIPAQSDPAKFTKLSQKYNFQTVFFSHTDQTPWGQTFLKNILASPEWSVVYIDDFIIILTRNNRIEELKLVKINLEQLSSSNYSYQNYSSYLRIAVFLSNNGYLASAKDFAKAGYQLSPQSPVTNQLLLYLAQRTQDQALIFTLTNKYDQIQNVWW